MSSRFDCDAGLRRRLFAHLHRGGRYAHLWTDAGHRSYWFRVDGTARPRERRLPRGWLAHNVYFTVNPLSRIPPHSGRGSRDPRYISSQLEYIAAINALFAEVDGKDCVKLKECQPELPDDFDKLPPAVQRTALAAAREAVYCRTPRRYKRRALAGIRRLAYAPSVIVDSGGGYHCYWLLTAPVPLDAANRADVQVVQHGWVQMVGGDPGAADLRRLLRVPGTYNHKPNYGNRPPRVRFVLADFDRLYPFVQLEEAVNDWHYAQRPHAGADATHRRPAATDRVREAFNRRHSLVELLQTFGYRVSYATPQLTRLARPGREPGRSSVTVFPAREDGAPELSVHFSTHDMLYSDQSVDAETGRVHRRVRDAYEVYSLLSTGAQEDTRAEACGALSPADQSIRVRAESAPPSAEPAR